MTGRRIVEYAVCPIMEPDHFCTSEPDIGERLAGWFEELPGGLLLQQETAVLERMLADLFGYYLVQIGRTGLCAGTTESCRIRTRLMLDMGRGEAAGPLDIRCDPLQLPIAADSVDVVVLPHTLDFARDPHRLLREVERVLIPEGRVILFGLNPWSLWGMWRLVRKQSGKIPWCGRFLSQRRVQDWLQLLGFEVEMTEMLMFRPPLRNEAVLQHLRFLEEGGRRFWPPLAGAYAIRAVQRVPNLTSLKPAWKRPAAIFGGRMIKPTTRSTSG